MFSGVKVQVNMLVESGMEALKNRQFVQALKLLDQALEHSPPCILLNMARGDCLAHLGRYVEGAKTARWILQHDQNHVGALYLRGFCLYHRNNIEGALTNFQQAVLLDKDHEKAKKMLENAEQFKEKRDVALKAVTEAHMIIDDVTIQNKGL